MPTRAPVHQSLTKAHRGKVEDKQIAERAERERERYTRHQRGYTNRWARASKLYLKEHPFCERHLERGISRSATVTDHRIPHRGDMRLFWDKDNWQALCKMCHDQKTASEDGGFGRYTKYDEQRPRPGRRRPGRTIEGTATEVGVRRGVPSAGRAALPPPTRVVSHGNMKPETRAALERAVAHAAGTGQATRSAKGVLRGYQHGKGDNHDQ